MTYAFTHMENFSPPPPPATLPPLKSSQEAQIPSLRPNFQPLRPNLSLETQIPALRPNSGLDAQILASRHKFQPRQHYLSPEAQILAPRPHYQPQGPNANCWKETEEKKIPLTCESIGNQPLRGRCPAPSLSYKHNLLKLGCKRREIRFSVTKNCDIQLF